MHNRPNDTERGKGARASEKFGWVNGYYAYY
jgi:hypothetical protein